MEIIGAAALIAVGIVLAAVLYGRVHGPGPVSRRPASRPPRASRPSRSSCPNARQRRSARGRPPAGKRACAPRGRAREGTRCAAGARQELARTLERVSGLSASRAKELLLKAIVDQARHDAARLIRQIEEATKRDVERRVWNILSVCMQRLAAGHAAETTVSVVHL